MPGKKPDQGRDALLLADLAALREALCGEYAEACNEWGEGGGLGLFRLFPGLDLESWAALAEKHGLHRWLPLPLDQAALPHLSLYQQTLDRLAYQTDHDPLTGLANRRSFERALDLEIERARRSRMPVCLALLDLDDFKTVNDTHGHPCGDEVLKALARVLLENKRRYDLAARIGGEEFALVLSGVGLVKSVEIMGRILSQFSAERFQGAEAGFSVTFSAGLATYRGGVSLDVAEFMALADKALYQAKGEGKNRIVSAPLPDVDKVTREATQVHANEKKFLFGK
jgi:diguanylate cyclase (GGDEF)-like protein